MGRAGAGTASSAGASFVGGSAQATATTDAAGIAISPLLVANTTSGRFVATAVVSGGREAASFLLSNRAGTPATLTAGVASTESTTAGTRFPIRLAVTVTDKDSNPVAGATVRFSAPEHGPSGRFGHRGGTRTITVTTNSSGVAVAPAFTATQAAGGYIVEATSHGARPAAFALVNSPREPHA